MDWRNQETQRARSTHHGRELAASWLQAVPGIGPVKPAGYPSCLRLTDSRTDAMTRQQIPPAVER